MTPAEGIRKLGFRRWYERQLIEGHLYFVTGFLSMIMLAAGIEQIDWRGPVLQLLFMLGVAAAALAVCIASLRQYNFLLVRAERFGEQSSCAQCRTYGVIQVLSASRPGGQDAVESMSEDSSWIRVRCKKCGHEWRMDND